jgi:hypothetical protein
MTHYSGVNCRNQALTLIDNAREVGGTKSLPLSNSTLPLTLRIFAC